jgi:hypothetical protein
VLQGAPTSSACLLAAVTNSLQEQLAVVPKQEQQQPGAQQLQPHQLQQQESLQHMQQKHCSAISKLAT